MITKITIVLLLSAFFSGMEIAYVSANKFRAELDNKLHKFSSSLVSKLLKQPSQYISTMLIGNNFALVLYSMFMAELLNPVLYKYTNSEFLILVSETVVATFIILIFAEYLPKVVFVARPNLFLRMFAVPVYFFYLILYPIAKFTIFLSNIVLKIFGVKQKNQAKDFTFGKIDLDHFLDDVEENSSESNELKYFKKALDLSEIKLRECIIPRTEIVAIEINEPIEKLKNLFVESGYSKILVYQDNIDNIIGYVHALDMFKKPKDIKSIMHKIIIVPETMSAQDLLTEFMEKRKNIAVVVDEFGGTAGIISMEDLLEEFIGEIEDEYDAQEFEEKKIGENKFIFSGRLEIDYLNEKYELDIPQSDEYETLAGFILEHHSDIPKVNDEIIIDNRFKIKILSSTNKKIDKVELELISRED
jgi:CBS domain containing-hemolysin-like protein